MTIATPQTSLSITSPANAPEPSLSFAPTRTMPMSPLVLRLVTVTVCLAALAPGLVEARRGGQQLCSDRQLTRSSLRRGDHGDLQHSYWRRPCQPAGRRRRHRGARRRARGWRHGKNGAASNDGVLVKWESVGGQSRCEAVLCDRDCPRLGAEEAECGRAVLLQGGGGGLGPRGHGAVGQAGGLRGHRGGAQRQAGLQQLSLSVCSYFSADNVNQHLLLVKCAYF